MVSKLINLAESIKDFLNEQTFLDGLNIVAERKFVSVVSVDDLEVSAYLIRVAPVSRARTRIGRGTWDNAPTIAVAVFRKLPADPATKDEEADEAMALVEQIEELLGDQTMIFDSITATPESTVIDPIYGQEAFKDGGALVSIINVKYTMNV